MPIDPAGTWKLFGTPDTIGARFTWVSEMEKLVVDERVVLTSVTRTLKLKILFVLYRQSGVGVATEITEFDLEELKNNPCFLEHQRDGYIVVKDKTQEQTK